MGNVGIFYGHFVYFTVIWYFYGHLVYIYYGLLVYLFPLFYVLSRTIWQPCWYVNTRKKFRDNFLRL
jgi:hypothetical protein